MEDSQEVLKTERLEVNGSQILKDVKLELAILENIKLSNLNTPHCEEILIQKYEELQKAVEEIDLSILDSSDWDSATSPSVSKRRKNSRTFSESNDGQLLGKLEKHLEETKKQIELVRNALNVIYDMQNASFKTFLSKNRRSSEHIISRIPFFKRLEESGQAIPLWVDLDDEKLPPLCGAMKAEDTHVADVGDMVAALLKNDNWILAEVIAYDPTERIYTIDDIFEDQKTEHNLTWNKVIPLPRMRADPNTHPEALHQKGELVLALYPGTSCFYRAVVGELPTNPEEPYKLLFEDEASEGGYSSPITVHQRYVIFDRYYEEKLSE